MSPIHIFAVFLFTVAVSSCGDHTPKESSTLLNRYDAPANHVTTAAVESFLAHAKEISTSQSQTGNVSVAEFVSIMPMKDDQRSIIAASYPGSFAVTCSDGLCNAAATGRATQAQMDVDIAGLPANPALALLSSVSTQFKMRSDSSVEFCNIQGMSAKKLFIKLKIQGLLLELQNNTPVLTVNIGDDSDNYTCR